MILVVLNSRIKYLMPFNSLIERLILRKSSLLIVVVLVSIGISAVFGWRFLNPNLQSQEEGFGIYLREDHKLVVSDEDFVSYNQTSHEIKLTKSGAGKIEALNISVFGDPFVVKIDGEEIYNGTFMTPISSLPVASSEAVIVTLVQNDTIRIQMGYPGTEPADRDPRKDSRVFDFFQKTGKLIQYAAQTLPNYVYDYYGGVHLFREGIYVLATNQDPRTLVGEFEVTNDFWKMLLESETINATDQDFISILLSRGNKPTGGYNIQIESFSWLESYPVKFLFQVNFTDPGEGVIVTQALTNPLVLVPIGKLTPGEYRIEVPIVWYILSIDEEGNPIYTEIVTFAPIIWEQSLTISKTEDFTPSATFKVILNGNEAPDLSVQVDLSNGLSEEEAKKIAEAAFIQRMGEKLHRLDTLIFDDNKITAHYTWGYNERDMGHIFDLTADLTTLKITINHCR